MRPVALAFLCSALLGCGASAANRWGERGAPGYVGRLVSSTGHQIAISRSEAAFNRFMLAAKPKDVPALRELALSGDVYLVTGPVSVKSLGVVANEGARVLILDGDHKGEEGYVPMLFMR